MPEYQLGDVNFVLAVNSNGDGLPVVHDPDASVLLDVDLDLGHPPVSLVVIGSIHQDLIEDFIKARAVLDASTLYRFFVIGEHPNLLVVALCGPDVGVGAQQDVLQLRLLLVYFLYWLVVHLPAYISE